MGGMAHPFRRICVFCGSSPGHHAAYADAARATGQQLAGLGIEVIYGGSNIGLMGIVADAALAAGGRVTGVIPDFFLGREVAHHGLSELVLTGSMHERKARMASLADAFLALPGGFGTFDELFEILTWAQLKLHAKPVGLLNVNGFFNPLLAMLQHATAEGFLRPEHQALVLSDGELEPLLHRMATVAPLTLEKV